MGSGESLHRLIVTADDFGRSSSINQAVIEAHRKGILTSASLMVGGAAAEEAVALAREHPRLGVGLHLTLVCGRAVSSPGEIPGLTDEQGEFLRNPVRAGFLYFIRRSLFEQLEKEIDAQLAKFLSTGLELDHVDGHLNIHLHPTILGILLRKQRSYGIRAIRLTRDPFWLNCRLALGNWVYRASHALIYWILSARARPLLRGAEIRHSRYVFGLLQNARVDADFVTRLLEVLPPGDCELYSHPSLDQFRHEFEALIHPGVCRLIRERKIQLIRYRDL